MSEKDLFIFEDASVKEALKQLDRTADKVLLVVCQDRTLLGTITDGDVRRYILGGRDLDKSITEVYNKKPLYIKREDFLIEKVKSIFIKNKIELIPILDNEGKVIDFTTWTKVFSENEPAFFNGATIDVPVIIMAGGEGKRLEPFSKIFPKSLIPIGEKPIIEIIMDEFYKQGVRQYYITLKHKGGMIEAYFSNSEKDYEITYVREKTFLGTAGALKLVTEDIADTFIVSNCDVIVKANFEDVLRFHKENKGILTVLSSIQHHKIPYGIMHFEEGGVVTNIREKPEYTFTINAGVYVLDKQALSYIPDNELFDMTDLIKCLVKNNERVLTYPVNEKDYIDIGQWEEYKKAVHYFQELKVI